MECLHGILVSNRINIQWATHGVFSDRIFRNNINDFVFPAWAWVLIAWMPPWSGFCLYPVRVHAGLRVLSRLLCRVLRHVRHLRLFRVFLLSSPLLDDLNLFVQRFWAIVLEIAVTVVTFGRVMRPAWIDIITKNIRHIAFSGAFPHFHGSLVQNLKVVTSVFQVLGNSVKTEEFST